MERIWLKEYGQGVPADVDLEAYGSIRDIFEQSCQQFADRPAFSNMGVTLSFSDLDHLSTRFGVYLQKTLGMESGQRLAIMLPNLLQYPVVLFGALRAGLAVVNVNPLYTPRELKHQLVDSGATAIVILENFAHTLQQVLAETPIRTVITTQIGDLFPFPKSLLVNAVVKHLRHMVPDWKIPAAVSLKQALKLGQGGRIVDPPLGHSDIAFIQYTGGTTGVSKGATLTHGNMVANIQQASAWLANDIETGAEKIITALPLYHIFSLTANCLTFMRFGGENILITNPRDFPGFVKELGKQRFTAITGVNTLFNALLNTPGFEALDFGSLKLTLGGGMAVQEAVARKWKAVTGIPLLEAYGLTETSPAVCMNPIHLKDYNGSIGLPMPSTEISFRDNDDNPLPAGDIGELCVRGPQVMRDYWQRDEDTREVINEDGWLHTGDVGRMDERGFCYIVDRKKDMILVSGFNVFPNEIEEVVASHPGVLEVAAIGVPDEKSGEAVKIFVVKKDPNLSEQVLITHCRENLTAYKAPRQVEFRDELPKTNVGKILRRALKTSS